MSNLPDNPPAFPPLINGKHYPLWQQFVDRQMEWIGGRLQNLDDGDIAETKIAETKITGIRLEPNGEDSAYFSVDGETFSCGFDVQYGGISGGEDGWLTFQGYGGHAWRIANLTPPAQEAQP